MYVQGKGMNKEQHLVSYLVTRKTKNKVLLFVHILITGVPSLATSKFNKTFNDQQSVKNVVAVMSLLF